MSERDEKLREILADHLDAIARIVPPNVWTVGDGKWTPEAVAYRTKVGVATGEAVAEITALLAEEL